MTITISHVLYADTQDGAARIIDNLIEQGVEEITARKEGNVYRIEYKVKEGENNVRGTQEP